jgi:hypothetical protein
MQYYREYLPELKTTTIFQDIDDESILDLLTIMGPKIVYVKAGTQLQLPESGYFYIVLKSHPPKDPEPRRFKYAMPKFGEPGMMMAEIPALSRFLEFMDKPPQMPGPHKPLEVDLDCLLCSGEMIVRFYNDKIAPVQSIMIRNFLGILAQKVMDVRQELFLLRDGVDIFNR